MIILWLFNFLLCAVYRGQRQVVVHVGNVLFRRLLYHTAIIRVHLFGQDVDRCVKTIMKMWWDCNNACAVFIPCLFSYVTQQKKKKRFALFTCPETDDRSGHIAVSQYSEDIEFDPSSTAGVHLHFGVVDGGRNYPLGNGHPLIVIACPPFPWLFLCVSCHGLHSPSLLPYA